MVTLIQKICHSHGIFSRETGKKCAKYLCVVCICVWFYFHLNSFTVKFLKCQTENGWLLNRYILIGSYCNCHGCGCLYLLVGLNACRDKCVCARVNMAVQLRKAIPKDLKIQKWHDTAVAAAFVVFFLLPCCFAIDIFHEYDTNQKKLKRKKCCRLSMLKFDTSKNQTNWAIAENANDLVWLLLFISSLFTLFARDSPVTRADAREKTATPTKSHYNCLRFFFVNFFVGFIFVKFMICSYIICIPVFYPIASASQAIAIISEISWSAQTCISRDTDTAIQLKQ